MAVSGTIVYCSREDAIPPHFAACLARLTQRHPTATVIQMVGNNIADMRNQAVLSCEGEWVWFIDTDMIFAPETLEALLAHQVDAVQTFVLKRHPPHDALIYHDVAGAPEPVLLGRMPSGAARLLEVASLGAGGTLYRRGVFERITGPWFEGVIGTEDTTFARKLRLAGFRLWVDLSTPCGHLSPMIIWPQKVRDTWHVRYEAMNGQSITFDPSQARLVRPPTDAELARVR